MQIAKENKLIGQEVNIATNSEITIGDVAEKIIKTINPEAKIISDEKRIRPENSEVERLYGCNEKILKNTEWKPKYTLDEGLKETIEWFRNSENLVKYKDEIYNI